MHQAQDLPGSAHLVALVHQLTVVLNNGTKGLPMQTSAIPSYEEQDVPVREPIHEDGLMELFLGCLFSNASTFRDVQILSVLFASAPHVTFVPRAQLDRARSMTVSELISKRDGLLGKVFGWQELMRVKEEFGKGQTRIHSQVSLHTYGTTHGCHEIFDIFMMTRAGRHAMRPISSVTVVHGEPEDNAIDSPDRGDYVSKGEQILIEGFEY
jgi:hypothetical protein